MKKHIFACVRNAGRSQMAAACVTVRARSHPAAGTRGACIIVTVLSGFLVIGFLIFGMFYQAWKEHQKRQERMAGGTTSSSVSVSGDPWSTTSTDFTVGDVKLREPLGEVQRRIGRPQAEETRRDGDRELVFRKGALRVIVNRDNLVHVVEARELKRKGKTVLRVGDAVNLVVPLLGTTSDSHSMTMDYPAPQKTVAHDNRSFTYHWGDDLLTVEALDEKVSHIYVQTRGPITPPLSASPTPRGSAGGSPGASDWR